MVFVTSGSDESGRHMAAEDKSKAASPPYTSWSSTKTLVATLSENGVPGRIDRSMLGKFSGAVAGQLLTAFRFLRLTDDGGHPTRALAALVEAYGTEEWPNVLAEVIRTSYAPLFELKLDTASPAQFNDAFRKAFVAEGDTFRKCVTFFLGAAKEANIVVSPYIMANKKPRTAAVKKKPLKSDTGSGRREPEGDGGGESGRGGGNGGDTSLKSADQMLLALLDPEKMSQEEANAVWTLLLYLKKKSQ